MIGVTLALTDGRIVKAGGTVVKNVAGYDLGKLVSGSFGTLGAIVDATFKLLPIPQASATLDAAYDDGDVLARDVMQVSTSQLEPMAFDVMLDGGTYRLRLRFCVEPRGSERADRVRAATAVEPSSIVVTGEGESAMSGMIRCDRRGCGAGAVIRFGWLPAKLAEITTLMNDVQTDRRPRGHGWSCGNRSRAGCESMATCGRSWPSSSGCGPASGLATSRCCGRIVELKKHVDVWGPQSSAADAARALKADVRPGRNPQRGQRTI